MSFQLSRRIFVFLFFIIYFIRPISSIPLTLSEDNIIDVSNDPNVISTLPSIAVDSYGIVHIAFWGTYDSTGAPDGVTTDIFYLNNKSGDFCSPIKIRCPSGVGYYSKDLTLAIDNEGNAHIAFRRSSDQIWDTVYDDIFYATNRNSDISNAILIIDGGMSGGQSRNGPRRPSIAVDDSGHVHIAFLAEAGTQIYYMKKIDGTFSTPIRVPGGRVWSVNPPSLAVDKQGFPHITFKGYSSIDQWGDIFYITNSSGEFESKMVPSDLGIEGDPTIAVDSNNIPHIVFNYYWTIYYTKKDSIGFSLPISIGSSDRQAANPFILCDRNNFIHVMCADDNYITNISGNFESFDIIDNSYLPTSGKHKIGISNDNYVHFAFHHSTGGYNYDIYYTKFKYDDLVPVELVNFRAESFIDYIKLSWATESEKMNVGYYIFRSDKLNGEYYKINEERIIQSSGTTTNRHEYFFIDENVIAGKTYYYKLADISYSGNLTFHGQVSATVELPNKYHLAQNYPNPFNTETLIRFILPNPISVKLTIFNINGIKVRQIVNKHFDAGSHTISWNGQDESGQNVASGTYIYKVETEQFTSTKKMLLLR